MKSDKLDKEIQQIQDYINEIIFKDPITIQERLLKLSQYIGWVAELKSQATEQLEESTGKVTVEILKREEKQSWSLLNNIIKAKVAKENKRVVQLDRIGSAITHQIDALRSILSFQKEELKNS